MSPGGYWKEAGEEPERSQRGHEVRISANGRKTMSSSFEAVSRIRLSLFDFILMMMMMLKQREHIRV